MDIAQLWNTFEETKRLTGGEIPPLRGIAYGRAYQALVKAGACPQIKRKYRGSGRLNFASAQHKARNEQGNKKLRVDPRWRGR